MRDRNRSHNSWAHNSWARNRCIHPSPLPAPQIEHLSLIECGAITGGGLKDALASASPRLVSVTVAGCSRVTRAAAEGIPSELGGRFWMDVSWQEAEPAGQRVDN